MHVQRNVKRARVVLEQIRAQRMLELKEYKAVHSKIGDYPIDSIDELEQELAEEVGHE